ncbi:GNAT family N-acetyltransferase [Methylobacterium nodulans]|uniref:GCN5-related N-acetyltransferase n=1 Tax=Methylobacterium nodulans (strain LMG 21967 / CNCM I-2342 / ORS 2060) TaxID=460265 RepID=B8IUC8_METNO|nr:GNAT family N-acetyltransferase [Methylobacterium nodulans]ACL55173.1 GCN5-related N-acetyltransferase [Methylobacterium nodulans ORS 2060]
MRGPVTDPMIRALSGEEALARSEALAAILVDCVAGGASVSFMAPLPQARAVAYWRDVAESVGRGERSLIVAEESDGTPVGTVQIVLAQPENQPHRADLSKVLVLRRARRRGIGAGLMRAAEDAARRAGKTLLVLDTASPEAERLYERAGWSRVGVIPGYALLPDGRPCDTVYFFKALA